MEPPCKEKYNNIDAGLCFIPTGNSTAKLFQKVFQVYEEDEYSLMVVCIDAAAAAAAAAA